MARSACRARPAGWRVRGHDGNCRVPEQRFHFSLVWPANWIGKGSPPRSLLGPMDLIAEAVQLPFSGIALSLMILTLLVLLRIVLRYERWAAIVALFLFAAVFSLLNPGHVYVAWLPASLYIGAVILLLTRFGLFAVVTTFVTADLLKFPITTDSNAFYFGNGLFAIVLVLALAAYGLYMSLGNRVVIGAGRLRT